MNPLIIDTGPLVSLLDRRDKHHNWAVSALSQREGELWTCDAVLSEAFYLLQRAPGGTEALLKLLWRGAVVVRYSSGEDLGRLSELMRKFSTVPMSFADACLVRMSEVHAESEIMTNDKDFLVYRRNVRQAIPLRVPFK